MKTKVKIDLQVIHIVYNLRVARLRMNLLIFTVKIVKTGYYYYYPEGHSIALRTKGVQSSISPWGREEYQVYGADYQVGKISS